MRWRKIPVKFNLLYLPALAPATSCRPVVAAPRTSAPITVHLIDHPSSTQTDLMHRKASTNLSLMLNEYPADNYKLTQPTATRGPLEDHHQQDHRQQKPSTGVHPTRNGNSNFGRHAQRRTRSRISHISLFRDPQALRKPILHKMPDKMCKPRSSSIPCWPRNQLGRHRRQPPEKPQPAKASNSCAC